MEENDKSNLIKNIIIIIVIIVMAIAFTYIFMQKDNKKPINNNKTKNEEEIQKQLSRIEEVLRLVDKKYIEEVDFDKLGTEAINGILAATGDVYTYYMTKEEYQALLVEGTEEYIGIGVHTVFDAEKNIALVFGVMPDTAAEKAGLRDGDILYKIDGVEVTKETYKECINSIRGKEGTNVTIIVKREDELIEKTIMREQVKANNIESRIINNNIGYIRILQFENDVAESFKTEYDKMRAAGVRGMILDLRNNPGGLLNETVDIADMLIGKGLIVKTVSKEGTQVEHKAKSDEEIEVPLMVLVNGKSASASEILCSALKDYEKGILIGEKTYGKGIVQRIEPLSDGSAISITNSKYYTKGGAEIHKNGIEPNIEVKLTDEEKANIFFDAQNDKQLNRAIEELNKVMKK